MRFNMRDYLLLRGVQFGVMRTGRIPMVSRPEAPAELVLQLIPLAP